VITTVVGLPWQFSLAGGTSEGRAPRVWCLLSPIGPSGVGVVGEDNRRLYYPHCGLSSLLERDLGRSSRRCEDKYEKG
jgi:hypothetical protein